jgi:hypothetical protein
LTARRNPEPPIVLDPTYCREVFDIWNESTAETLLVVNATASTLMTGLIWFVQIVHYPLLASTPPDRTIAVATDHQRRTSYVVALPMAVEGITTLGLLADAPSRLWWGWPWLGAILLAVSLGSTILLSVPLHARMARGYSPDIGRRLVLTNWPRTISWTLRSVLTTALVISILK